MLKIYLAGPISGCTYQQATEWRHWIRECLDPFHWQILDPMSHTDELKGQTIGAFSDHVSLLCSSKAIVTRDKHMVKQADIVLFNLSYGSNVLIGTSVELGWASALGKVCLTILPDGSRYDHPFVRELSLCVPTFEDALDILRSYEPPKHSN